MDIKNIETLLDKSRYKYNPSYSDNSITSANFAYPNLLKSLFLLDENIKDSQTSLLLTSFSLIDFLLNVSETNKHDIDILKVFFDYLSKMHSSNGKINFNNFSAYIKAIDFSNYKKTK